MRATDLCGVPAHLVRNVPTPVRSNTYETHRPGGPEVSPSRRLAATVIPTAAKADLSYGPEPRDPSPIVVPAGGVLSGLGVGQTVPTAAPGCSGPIVVTMPGASGVTIKNLTVDGEGRVGRGSRSPRPTASTSKTSKSSRDDDDRNLHVGPASGQRWTEYHCP